MTTSETKLLCESEILLRCEGLWCTDAGFLRDRQSRSIKIDEHSISTGYGWLKGRPFRRVNCLLLTIMNGRWCDVETESEPWDVILQNKQNAWTVHGPRWAIRGLKLYILFKVWLSQMKFTDILHWCANGAQFMFCWTSYVPIEPWAINDIQSVIVESLMGRNIV